MGLGHVVSRCSSTPHLFHLETLQIVFAKLFTKNFETLHLSKTSVAIIENTLYFVIENMISRTWFYREVDYREPQYMLSRTWSIISRTLVIEKKISTVKGLLFSITSLFLENKYLSRTSYTRSSDQIPATISRFRWAI